MKKIISFLLFLSTINFYGCSTPSANITPKINSNERQEKKFSLEMLIEKKLPSGEVVHIGSKAVENVSINEFDYPLTKLIKNQLIIEIDDITAGKHKLNLSLYELKEPFSIPLIIPNSELKKIIILIRLFYNEETKTLDKVEYGYDFDRNGIIDLTANRFEMEGKNKFYFITPEGIKKKLSLDISLNRDAISDELLLPPGVLPAANGQSVAEEMKIPQEQNIDLRPKPLQNEVYPLPPGIQRPEQNNPFPDNPVQEQKNP